MANNTTAATQQLDWPDPKQLEHLSRRDWLNYADDWCIIDHISAVERGVLLLQGPNIMYDQKWMAILKRHKEIWPEGPGRKCLTGHNFVTKLGRHKKRMRDLIEKDTAISAACPRCRGKQIRDHMRL